jgi:hypothetical protein
MIKERRTPMRRRLRSASVVIISQMLLIAMAIAWLFHMISIAIYGAVYFIERNQFVLWAEIIICVLITGFAIYVLALQIQRLGERRQSDRRTE